MRGGCNQAHALGPEFSREFVCSSWRLRQHNWQAENRACRSPNHFRIERTDGAFSEHHAGAAERFRRAQDRAEISRILQSDRNHDRPELQPLENVIERKLS